ncbi:MAG: DUF2157 domain-containing protein [gamma proteobacterium symbiont of Taylorina sp.]|nr:DUF2157 domain-containing protein [gamma proteobacterium symbiont of Taylorina sp.]
MNNKKFYNQLAKKLPDWQAQGWIDHVGAQAILQDTRTSIHKPHKLSIILGILGVMLLAAGSISFFAANWQGMSKLLKLSLLLSSMISAYLVSAYCFSSNINLLKPRYPAMGQAFLLLGVLLFGNNIMLIAQIYHIDSHYPNGVLLWACGALLTAVLMRSEIVMITANLLALLWSGMEIFDFQQDHWQWLIFLSVSTYFVLRYDFKIASHFTIVSFFIWALFNMDSFSDYFHPIYLVQLYLLVGISLFLTAKFLILCQIRIDFNEKLSFYALCFSLIFLYILSFPDFDFSVAKASTTQYSWLLINLGLTGLIAILVVVNLKMHKKALVVYQIMGILWLSALLVTLLVNIYYFHEQHDVIVVFINVLILLLVVWLIYSGLAEHNRFYVNAAFVVFSITLISRYFDTFWSLMSHSLFFISGGLLLIVGGYWLERKRRQLSLQLITGALSFLCLTRGK